MMRCQLSQRNHMRSSLKFLRSGFRGLTSSLSSLQSLSTESKNQQSELKQHVINRVKEATQGMPEQKLILTTITPLLDGISDEGLLGLIKLAHLEFTEILAKFARPKVPVMHVAGYEIQAVQFVDED